MRSWAALASLFTLAGITAWSWWPTSRDHRGIPSAEELAEAARAHPVTLLVDFRDDVSDAALATNGYVEEPISRFSTNDRLYRIRFNTPDEAQAAVRKLRQDPTVESVDYDAQVHLSPGEDAQAAGPVEAPECAQDDSPGAASRGFPNDPCYRYQWNLRQVGLPAAWKLGQGQGAVVAVIDTGVSHVPDLEGASFVPGFNFVGNNEKADDDHGHGTHVAGTIAQATNNKRGVAGIAFGASIMPLKVLSAQGAGSMGAIAQAIRFAADHGAQVINMSLGGPFPVTPVRKAIEYAHANGVVVVAAAGNDGRGRVSYPARYPNVLAVAATQYDESTTFYSNWGKEIDIAAPGGNVRVDQNGDGKPDGILQNTILAGGKGNGYLWFMGTSMAAPHVAGIAALVVGAGVTRPDAVEKVLLDSARKPKAAASTWKPWEGFHTFPRFGSAGQSPASPSRLAGHNDHYGSGIADAQAALEKAKRSRGMASLGLGAGLALLGLGRARRRQNLTRSHFGSLGAALVLGASGLFFLPSLGAPAWLSNSPFGSGVLPSLAGLLGPAGQGNPLLWSALLPLAAIALLYGRRSLRPTLAGLCFGVAGALLFAACALPADIRFVPDVLDRVWLVINAVVATGLGSLVVRR